MNPINLKKVKPGDPVTAKWANALYEKVMSCTPRSGPDIGIRAVKGGWVPWLKRRTKSGGGGGSCAALAISLAEVDGTWKATVAPGYVNNLMPEIASNPIDDDPAPTLTVSAAGGVYLQVQWEPGSSYNGIDWIPSGGTVNDADIIFSASVPSDTDPEVDIATGAPTTNGVYNFQLASVVATDDGFALSTTRPGHRFATICGEECRVSWNGC
jgi:hypothetical protein